MKDTYNVHERGMKDIYNVHERGMKDTYNVHEKYYFSALTHIDIKHIIIIKDNAIISFLDAVLHYVRVRPL